MQAEHQLPRRSRHRWIWVILIFGTLLALAMIGGGFWFAKHRSPASSSQAQVKQRIVREVSAIYLVPTNEQPSVAIVQDPTDLHQFNSFFKQAKKGDFVVLYSRAHLMLLYRENQNKLIGVASVSPQAPSTGSD